jgi:hypothetical protein
MKRVSDSRDTAHLPSSAFQPTNSPRMIASRPAKYPIFASAHAVVSDTESRMGSSLGDSMETKQAAKIRLFSRTFSEGEAIT